MLVNNDLFRDGRSRQLGFIGYHTPQAAKQAVYYFNNTYLDTSKISVEMAKPV
jgi:multiple RNA-binding domain-containing protein 1